EAGVPYVLVNRHLGDHPAHSVTVHWEDATGDALRRLTRAGHRATALLLPEEENTAVAGRAAGWAAAARWLALDPRDAPVLRSPGSTRGPDDALSQGEAVTRCLLREGLPGTGRVPTAIVGFNDWCALGVLRAAAAAGVAVPGDLSVIGFDNTLLGA